jgi:hypothetical protein
MVCPKCQSSEVSVVPAEIRLYRNFQRSLSHPPMTPSPDIQVCLDCGWSEFSIPRSWLAAGWVRPLRPKPVTNVTSITREDEKIAIAS